MSRSRCQDLYSVRDFRLVGLSCGQLEGMGFQSRNHKLRCQVPGDYEAEGMGSG